MHVFAFKPRKYKHLRFPSAILTADFGLNRIGHPAGHGRHASSLAFDAQTGSELSVRPQKRHEVEQAQFRDMRGLTPSADGVSPRISQLLDIFHFRREATVRESDLFGPL